MALSRPLKWFLLGLGGLAATLLLAALLLPSFVDLQRLGPMVSAQVGDATGRAVTLGRISFRLLPAPALSVAPVTVAEGPRYPGRDAVRLQSLAIRMRVLPLLRGRIEFGSIVLDSPEITLIRDRQGRWNYDDILTRATAAKTQSSGGGPASPSGPAFAVGRIDVRGGRLVLYDDAVVPGKRSEVRVGPVDATLSGWGTGGPARLDLSAGLGHSRLKAAAQIAGQGDAEVLDATLDSSRLVAADFVTLLPWLGVANPRGLKVGGEVVVEGRARVPLQRLEAVTFDGTLTVEGLSYLDASMGRPLEKVGGRLEVHDQKAEWKDFTAAMGSSVVRGRLQVEDFLRPRIGFELDCPRVDLNEMIAAFAGAPVSAAASGGAPAKGTGDGLLHVNARGTVKIGALRFQTFDLADVRGSVLLQEAVLAVSDLSAKLYGGGLKGSASLDLARQAPGYGFKIAFDGVDVNALAGAYDPALKDLLRGRLGGRMSLDATGMDLNGILGSARGTARLEIAKGSLTSFSILKQLAGLLEFAGGKGIGREETPFEALSGTFSIGERRARTSDLTLDSADLDLAGEGDIGLDASLDLAVAATFSEDSTRGMIEKTPRLKALTDPAGRLAVHLLAKGNLAKPQIGLDTRAQTRQLGEQKKAEVKEKVRGRLIDLLTGKPKDKETPPPPPPPR
jgi:AsmA protein